MNWTRRGLLAVGAIGAAAPQLAWADQGAPTLWVVREGPAKVFLFGDGGSLTDPWRSEPVEAAFRQSSVFWKETPDPGPRDLAKYIAKGIDRAHPLSTWLTAQQRDRVAAAAVSAGTTYAFLEPMQPWFAAGALSSAYAGRRKPTPDPITVLTAAAKAAGMPVHTEFPDIDSLIDWASGLSRAAQVQYLLYTIETNEAGPAMLDRRLKALAVGDFRLETQQVLHVRAAYPDLYPPLEADRNRRWPGRFRTMLDAGGTTFVLVGADHLVGPDSVLVQLATAGMRPRRP
jgi:hypothetical protein